MAGPGELDASFGVGGVELIDFGAPAAGRITASVRQADGKILVAGPIQQRANAWHKVALGRLNADGTPDLSFGTNGWTAAPSSVNDRYGDMQPVGIAVGPDGSIVVLGHTDGAFLVRFSPSGMPDTTFGFNGDGISWDYSWTSGATPHAVAVLPSGYILVAGGIPSGYYGSPLDSYVARYDNTRGHIDFTFGSGGVARVAFGDQNDEAEAIMADVDGGFWVAGYAQDCCSPSDAYVARFTAGGALDPSFGTSGVTHIEVWRYDAAFALARDSIGRLLVGGRTSLNGDPATTSFAVSRLTASGQFDSSFGQGGMTYADIFQNGTMVTAVSLDTFADDGVLATGNFVSSSGDSDFAMAHFTPSGNRDYSFGSNGVVISPSTPDMDQAVAGYVLADGRVLAIGGRTTGTTETPLLARFDASGTLDPTFADAGISTVLAYLPSDDIVISATRMPDGKVMGATYNDGGYSFFRMLSDGTLDPSFGTNGVVPFSSNLLYAQPVDTVAQPDGKLVVLLLADGGSPASFYNAMGVMRLNADGTRDTTFNGTGEVFVDIPSQVQGIALQPDGKVLVTGYTSISTPSGYRYRMGVARVTTDGALDPAFGAGSGKVIVDRPGIYDELSFRLAVQGDGRILVGGRNTLTSTSPNEFVVVRLLPDGALDTSWGSGGAARSNFDGVYVNGLALDGDGNVVIAGACGGPNNSCMARFTPAGALDTTFNGTGMVTLPSADWSAFQAIAIQADNKVVALSTVNGFTIARYAQDGTLDPSFNGNGMNTVASPPGQPLKMVLQSDGKPVAFALANPFGDHDLMAVRFQGGGDSTPDAFSFDAVTDALPGTLLVSNTVTITGLDAVAPIGVTGGEYSIGCGAGWTAVAGTITNGQTVCVRHTTASAPQTATNTTLTVGGVSATFTSTTATAPDTSITASPPNPSSSASASFSFSATNPSATFACQLDAGSFAACTSPQAYSGLTQGSHTFQVRATANGFTDATPATFTWTIDTAAPDVTLSTGPTGYVNVSNASFSFNSSDPTATFECHLDGAPFAACTSPVNFTGLADGAHTFEVRAKDAAGNLSAPASRNWTVDTVAPDTTLLFVPVTSPTNSTSATASFNSPESGVSFECRLDGAAFASCTSVLQLTGLAEGSHTFDVRARDAAGNVDATPATRTWVIDLTPPDTSFTSTPPALSASNVGSFAFASNESGSGFECRFDGAAFGPCLSPRPFSGFSDGAHTFDVRAKDAAGNLDPTPASYMWTIDTTAPDTSITSGPSGSVASTSATFAFGATEASTFQCSVDGGGFAACASPLSLSGLAQGSHTFQVRATDAVGNTDATPAAATWTVDTVAPDTTITSAPANNTAPPATFTFSSNEGGGTFECRLDGAAFAACPSPTTYSSLAKGNHTFDVRAKDAAGNLDPTPATYTWRSK